MEGVVKTAFSLTPEEKAALEARLHEIYGAPVRLTEQLDKALIAGISVEINGRVMDNSLKGRLETVSRLLMKRGSGCDA